MVNPVLGAGLVPVSEPGSVGRLARRAVAARVVQVELRDRVAAPVVAGLVVVGSVGPAASRLQAVAANRLRVADPRWDRMRPFLVRWVDSRWVVRVGPRPDLVHQNPNLQHRWPVGWGESDQPAVAASAVGVAAVEVVEQAAVEQVFATAGLGVVVAQPVVRTATPETAAKSVVQAVVLTAGAQVVVVAVVSGLVPVEAVAEPGG